MSLVTFLITVYATIAVVCTVNFLGSLDFDLEERWWLDWIRERLAEEPKRYRYVYAMIAALVLYGLLWPIRLIMVFVYTIRHW